MIAMDVMPLVRHEMRRLFLWGLLGGLCGCAFVATYAAVKITTFEARAAAFDRWDRTYGEVPAVVVTNDGTLMLRALDGSLHALLPSGELE
jgi:hypothetical protein